MMAWRWRGAWVLALALAGGGCLPALDGSIAPGDRVSRLAADEARPALRRLDAPDPAVRGSACRALAADAERLRRAGDQAGAERHVHWIVDRFGREGDPAVRHTIVALCAPAMGRGGSPRTVAFLRGCIASGDLAGTAALVLADLAPEGVFDMLAPLAEHPVPEIRADAALALVLLGDPRGEAPARGVLAEMRPPSWPRRLRGVTLEEARASLAARAERVFGPPMPAPAPDAAAAPR